MRVRGLGRVKSIGRKLRNRFSPGALILLYHRVAELESDPQQLQVSASNFAAHLRTIKEIATPIPLPELVSNLHSGKVPARSVVVTFDDGAADNLLAAKPILEREDVPATIFIATGYMKTAREYWWDEVERLVLQPGDLPSTLSLTINRQVHKWHLTAETNYSRADYEAHSSWHATRTDEPTLRQQLYRELINVLYPLGPDERFQQLDYLKQWAGDVTISRDTHRPLTVAEVKQLAASRHIEIGAHTVSHSMLSALPASQQRQEIEQSKADLEEILGSPVRSFAYPFGTLSDYTSETVSLVRQLGFDCACSNFKDLVQPGDDVFQLPRLIVRDWTQEEFANRVASWFRGDL
jgi:peptidoglycan/xylan/chitin deacetylase (PgdA/CDA1 family)